MERALGLDEHGYMPTEGERVTSQRIRERLAALAAERDSLEAQLERVRANLAGVLREADADPSISVTEAAGLAGLSRFSVYKALERKD